MRKIFFLLFLLSAGAFAQNNQCTSGGVGNNCVGTITAVDTSCTKGQCVNMPLSPAVNSAAISLAGTFSATLQFEVSLDNVNFSSVSCTPSAGGSATSTAAGTGIWQCPVFGFSYIRVRPSAYTSGTAQVSVQASGGGSTSGTTTSTSTIIGVPTFAGVGLNDFNQIANAGRTYTGTTPPPTTFTIKISATGTPDQFQWKQDSGAFSSNVGITTGFQALSGNVQIAWTASTGHTLNDQWTIKVTTTASVIGTATNSSRIIVGNPATLNVTDTATYYLDDPNTPSWFIRPDGAELTNPNYAAGALMDSSTGNVAYSFIGVATATNPLNSTKVATSALEGDAYMDGAGVSTLIQGVGGFVMLTGTGSVTQMTSFYADTNATVSGARVGKNSGVYIADEHGISSTQNAALEIANQGAGANDYAIYVAGGQSKLGALSIDNSGSITSSGNINLTGTRSFSFGGHVLLSSAAPTISSGFGTSPSVTANNGAAAFRVNVGTGGAASAGVVGLPTATTGWNCFASDVTTPASNLTRMSASSTTTATLTNYNTSGVATAWPASDVLAVSCFAY